MKNNNKGFTLIEVLIAFTILGFITIGMFSITDNSIATKERVLTEDERYLNAKMAFDIIARDLNNIYSPLYFTLDEVNKGSLGVVTSKSNNAQSQYSDLDKRSYSDTFPTKTLDKFIIPKIISEKSKLTFLSAGHIRKIEDIKQSNYEWIEYSLDSKDKQYNIVRKVEANDIFEEDLFKNSHAEIVLENVKKLEFLFWNVKKKKFTDYRSLSSLEKNKWRAIQVKITWINSDEKEIEETRVYRPIWPQFDISSDWKKRLEIAEKNLNIDKNPVPGTVDPPVN